MDTTEIDAPRGATRHQLAWLHDQVVDWQAAGIIEPHQASAITGRYRLVADPGAKVSLGRILLWLGGAFVGVGLIWLVAANLAQLSPTTRFAVVAVLWASFLVGSEVLDARHASRALTGAIRLLAALGFGALVLQAAQSLQVPAFEPVLLGVWSAGSLLHGYLTRSTMPFLVGLLTGVYWWIAQPMWADGSSFGAVLVLGAGTVVAASLATIHDARLDAFAWWWRLTGAALALATLFAAAIPGIHGDEVVWTGWLVAELVVAALVAAAALAVAVRRGQLAWVEPVGAVAVVAASALLTMWDTGTDVTDVGPDQWAHAGLSVLAYVGLAVGLVALDAVRQHRALTWLAMTALVVFTTFQSFAVFAPIVTGAWLFVVLGTVFLGTGFLFDRARRELAQAIDHTTTDGDLR